MKGGPASPPLASPDINDPAVFIYTSGTTGRPKGAVLSHRNLLSNCEMIEKALRFQPEDNLLCVLPLFHSFAGTVCQNTSLYMGARFTMMEQFHPARVLEYKGTNELGPYTGEALFVLFDKRIYIIQAVMHKKTPDNVAIRDKIADSIQAH